ncbi:hypothetical protein B0H16DRAFT_1485483 [Mycena metata]|uniref:Uncharacterized protein n=1 Tax=Mycena metata TaxID=1033252 RepID=A0AAD7DQ71_9AGAR|nr:hypothetical protein B0H16DRAFT_1485483 [Mycena metata]
MDPNWTQWIQIGHNGHKIGYMYPPYHKKLNGPQKRVNIARDRESGAYRESRLLHTGMWRIEEASDANSESQLQKGANDARSDDFRRVSGLIPEWVNKDMNTADSDLAVFGHTPSITVMNEKTGQPHQQTLIFSVVDHSGR